MRVQKTRTKYSQIYSRGKEQNPKLRALLASINEFQTLIISSIISQNVSLKMPDGRTISTTISNGAEFVDWVQAREREINIWIEVNKELFETSTNNRSQRAQDPQEARAVNPINITPQQRIELNNIRTKVIEKGQYYNRFYELDSQNLTAQALLNSLSDLNKLLKNPSPEQEVFITMPDGTIEKANIQDGTKLAEWVDKREKEITLWIEQNKWIIDPIGKLKIDWTPRTPEEINNQSFSSLSASLITLHKILINGYKKGGVNVYIHIPGEDKHGKVKQPERLTLYTEKELFKWVNEKHQEIKDWISKNGEALKAKSPQQITKERNSTQFVNLYQQAFSKFNIQLSDFVESGLLNKAKLKIELEKQINNVKRTLFNSKKLPTEAFAFFDADPDCKQLKQEYEVLLEHILKLDI